MTPSDILNKAEALLQGEPARAIGYGAALVIVGVSLVSNALGYTRIPAIDLPTAVTDATFAIATVVGVIESIRHFVTPVASLPSTDGDTT
jgi:hypothetical protein